MNGEYSEKLKSGGDLIVSSKSWYIRYYFPGPDLRYNGTFVNVPGVKLTSISMHGRKTLRNISY